MKYLVTGAAGFIGAAIASRLIDEGNEVITIDNLSTGSEENIPEGTIFYRGNTYDESIISELELYKFDAIIHMAGQSSGEVSFEMPVYDAKTNIQSTLLLLDYAKRYKIKRFVYASSMSVYGDVGDILVTEDMAAVPKSFYAAGKLASENYMSIYSKEYGIANTALRFFNVYGVGQNMDNLKQGMVSIYMAQAIKNKHIIVKGSKDRYRDFVYIDDVVSAVQKSLSIQTGYHCYNVAAGRATRVEELIKLICNELPYEVKVDYVDGTPGDQFGIFGSSALIERELGWEPTINLEEGIKNMTEWAVRHLM